MSENINPASVKTDDRSSVWRSAQIIRILIGVVLALIVVECLLRPFSSALSNTWQPVTQDDPSEAAAKEVRQYFEGIAVSHFSSSHARLTGHPWLQKATTIVLLGDSYVEALHVNDTETAGAQLEQLARRSGHPLNVRQYGWSGANAATYVAVAPAISQRWGSARVVIFVNHGDMDSEAFLDTTKFVVEPDLSLRVESRDEFAAVRPTGIADWVLRHSTLAYVLGRRWLEIRSHSATVADASSLRPDADSETTFIRVSIRELNRAYSGRLLLVYIPETRIDRTIGDRAYEAAFLSSCTALHVNCLTEVETLLAGMRSGFVRGVPNTAPSAGHINARGYSMIAEDVWKRHLKAVESQ